MLRIYRICRKVYDPKDPTGASQTLGRWHLLGQRVLYFCSSLAMCILELKANAVSFDTIRQHYHYTSLEINPDELEEVPKLFYNKNWTFNRQLTQNFGDEWFKNSSLSILKVYSAVLPTDFNFILNTTHSNFQNLKFPNPKQVPLDKRVK